MRKSTSAACSLILAVALAHSVIARSKSIAEQLGFPDNAKLVILHADDLGVSHSVDEASFAALDRKAVSSASVMMPCPWVTEVATYAKAHPDADLGLHLTLTSEWKTYKWGPVSSRSQVSTLLAPDGNFYPDVESVVQHAKPEEVEREIRAQVELAMKLGVHPTHLDMHMATLAARPEFYAALVRVGHDYHLPFLAVRVNDERQKMLSLLSSRDILMDSLVMFNQRVPAAGWTQAYVDALRSVQPGLTYLIVHLGHDDDELRAITLDHPDYGSAWRERDFQAVTSPEFKHALEENHIVLISWKDLQRVM